MMTRITDARLSDARTQAVLRALTGAGHQAWFVGGCVRNALLGLPVSDIDIATDALPDQVITLAARAGLRPVPTGLPHGTVTVVSGGVAHEVTTFRRDVQTDGRRAVVAFSGTIGEDARRRDLTINALYAGADGYVRDPTGKGLADLKACRVRFIGDAGGRIREDYLRILRFFRFYAWYGGRGRGPDADGLAACAANAAGMKALSSERVGAEMLKLLAAPDPSPAMAVMAGAGVLAHVLPGAGATWLPGLVAAEAAAGAGPDPLRRLAAIYGDGEGGDTAARLRLSRAETRRLRLLRDWAGQAAGAAELGYRLGEGAALDVVLLRAALSGQMPGDGVAVVTEAIPAIRSGARATFPVRAGDLAPRLSGPALGAALRRLETDWIRSGFTLDRAALLARL